MALSPWRVPDTPARQATERGSGMKKVAPVLNKLSVAARRLRNGPVPSAPKTDDRAGRGALYLIAGP